MSPRCWTPSSEAGSRKTSAARIHATKAAESAAMELEARHHISDPKPANADQIRDGMRLVAITMLLLAERAGFTIGEAEEVLREERLLFEARHAGRSSQIPGHDSFVGFDANGSPVRE